MKLVTTLNKNSSTAAGGRQIGGFLATALANSKSELVMPINTSGPFSKPHFAPDVERMAKLKLESSGEAILQGIKDGSGSVKGLINVFKKKKQ